MTEQKKSWFAKHKILTVLIVLIFMAAVGSVNNDKKTKNQEKTVVENSTTPTESTNETKTSEAKVGEEGKLFIEGATQMYIAVDESALDEFTKAAIVNDTYGQAELVLANKVFAVNNGTKVQVIDLAGFGKKKIRVLEGEMIGKSGWVAKEFVIKD